MTATGQSNTRNDGGAVWGAGRQSPTSVGGDSAEMTLPAQAGSQPKAP